MSAESKSDFVFPDPGVPTLPIERLEIDSEQAARYVAEARPFVARVRDWGALEWSLDYLSAKVGDVDIKTWKKTGDQVEMKLAEYLGLVEKPAVHGEEYVIHNYPVMRIWDWWGPVADYEPLFPDVKLPAFIKTERISGMNIWVRNTGWYDNKSHCESNAAAAINLQIRGRKHVWLFPPEDAPRLGVEIPREHLMEPAFFSTEQTVYQPSPEHPEFKNVRCYETVLEPGDVIHIPPFWYHWFVHYNTFQMNFNCWFSIDTLPLNPVSAQWAYMNALSLALGDLPNLQQQFTALPLETQELLTKIANILVVDPRCTESVLWREISKARAQQTLNPRVFVKKKTT